VRASNSARASCDRFQKRVLNLVVDRNRRRAPNSSFASIVSTVTACPSVQSPHHNVPRPAAAKRLRGTIIPNVCISLMAVNGPGAMNSPPLRRESPPSRRRDGPQHIRQVFQVQTVASSKPSKLRRSQCGCSCAPPWLRPAPGRQFRPMEIPGLVEPPARRSSPPLVRETLDLSPPPHRLRTVGPAATP